MPGAQKIGVAISDPRIAGGKITDILIHRQSKSPKTTPDKATLPDFPLFLLAFSFLFGGIFFAVFLCFPARPGLICVFRIFYGLNKRSWDDWPCQGWVWVQPIPD